MDCKFWILLIGENINLCWSPDGQTIAVGNKEDLITFIDVRTSKVKFTEQFKLEVNEFAWNKDGSLFFLTTGQGSIIIHRSVGVVFQAHNTIQYMSKVFNIVLLISEQKPQRQEILVCPKIKRYHCG